MAADVRHRIGRFGTVIVAASVLMAVLAFMPATDAAGGVTITEDAGVILLSTGPDPADNWVRYFAAPASPLDVTDFDAEQAIDVRRCKATAGDSLLEITPSPATADLGLVTNGFGARTKDNCATGNGQINVDQDLTITLGSSFGSRYALASVEVDIEGKQNASLAYALGDNAGSGTRSLNAASDNGADAGTSDNTIVVLTGDDDGRGGTKLFDSVTLAPTGNGKALISVEGGGDGQLQGPSDSVRGDLEVNQTLFTVVATRSFDGDLDCGDTVGPTSISATGPALTGEVVRGSNTKAPDCPAVPYTFQIQDDSVLFDYIDDGRGARFIVKIEWDPEDIAVDPLDPPDREINYFPNDDPSAFVTGLACVAQISDADPLVTTPQIGDVFEHPIVDGEVVPWCLAGEHLVLTAGGWQQIQWWDGTGDPRWK
jgi:hypothetical protein